MNKTLSETKLKVDFTKVELQPSELVIEQGGNIGIGSNQNKQQSNSGSEVLSEGGSITVNGDVITASTNQIVFGVAITSTVPEPSAAILLLVGLLVVVLCKGKLLPQKP